MLFRRKKEPEAYDREKLEPVIRVSICTGEEVAGFRNRSTGKFTDVQLLRSPEDLQAFQQRFGLSGELPRIY